MLFRLDGHTAQVAYQPLAPLVPTIADLISTSFNQQHSSYKNMDKVIRAYMRAPEATLSLDALVTKLLALPTTLAYLKAAGAHNMLAKHCVHWVISEAIKNYIDGKFTGVLHSV